VERHILHISDLHASEGNNDQKVIVEAFLNDLKIVSDSGFQPDLVIFSGDIVYSADLADSYLPAMGWILSTLSIFNLPETCLICAPGNHDASRDFVLQNIEKTKKFRLGAQEKTKTENLFKSSDFVTYANSKFKNYWDFMGAFNRSMRSKIAISGEQFLFPDSKLAVVTINTALLSGAGVDGLNDWGNLAVSEHDIRSLFDDIPPGYETVVVGHHPAEWLNEQSRSVLDSLVARKSVSYLHGHMHDMQPKLVSAMAGNCLFAQSGALFTSRDYYNGYSLISMTTDPLQTRVQLRSYYDKREQFDAATDQISEGVFYASALANEYWTKEPINSPIANWAEKYLAVQLLSECNDSLSNKPLADVFVEPEFEREIKAFPTNPIKMGTDREILSFQTVISASDNYIIGAQQESGKTSLLRFWAINAAQKVESDADSKIPVVTSFDHIPTYPARYTTFLNRSLPNLPDGFVARQLADQGRILFLIDDVDFRNHEKMLHLQNFIEAFPKCRFVMSTVTALLSSGAFEPMIGELVEFHYIHLKPLRTGQLRQLIERHGLAANEDVDILIDKMYNEMTNLSVPLTAVTSTFLIQIYQDGDTGVIVNKAKLIERFVEILLEKFAVQDLLPGSFDFENKTHLLSYITQQMVDSGRYIVPESDILRWILEYLKKYGMPYSARSVLDYLKSSRVLIQEDDHIKFKLKAFFELFCAMRMKSDNDFKNYIFHEDRYLSYINEISFYGALARDDLDSLELVFSRFENTFNLQFDGDDEEGEIPTISARKLKDLRLPSAEATHEELYDIEAQIFDRRLTQDERDNLLDSSRSDDTVKNQSVVRTLATSDTAKSIGLLMLLSSLIKHVELVPDPRKREMMRELMDGWNEFTLVSLALIPAMASKKRYWFGGVEYRLNFPDTMEADEIARRLFLTMPISVARTAFLNLGTEKLKLQLEEGLGDATEPLERQLIKFCILMDLGLPGLGEISDVVWNQLIGNKYLSNVMLIKIHDSLIKLRVPPSERKKVREIAADIIAGMNGGSRRQIGERKGKAINQLKKYELFLEYKSQRE
jgi:predicted MPP superfamily phosphohydrolase